MSVIVPAQPGFYQLIAYLNSCEGPVYSKLPVVAWSIEDDVGWPIVMFDDAAKGAVAIQYPDGTVFEDYPMTEEEWRERVRQLWEERQQSYQPLAA